MVSTLEQWHWGSQATPNESSSIKQSLMPLEHEARDLGHATRDPTHGALDLVQDPMQNEGRINQN